MALSAGRLDKRGRNERLAIRVVVAAAVAVSLAPGCGEDPRATTQSLAGCCERGRSSTLYPLGCLDSRDCPQGTVCTRIPQREAASVPACPECCTAKRSDATGQCLVPLEPSSAALLMTGFGVGEFALDPVSDGAQGAFRWEGPRDTRFVTCALFRSEPVIATVGDGARIVNQEDSMVAYKVYSHPKGTFDLSDRTLTRVETNANAQCGPDPANLPAHRFSVFTELTVGCWAYSDFALIGATQLHSVAPERAGLFKDSITTDCSPRAEVGDDGGTVLIDRDGQSCLVPRQRTYGTCLGGFCRQRCVTRASCRFPGALGLPPPPTCPSGDQSADAETPDALAAETDGGSLEASIDASLDVGADAAFDASSDAFVLPESGDGASDADGGGEPFSKFECARPFDAKAYLGLCVENCDGG
jgi:hypothetical protein